MSSYEQGHLFEEYVKSYIKAVIKPDWIRSNVLFNPYPTYEIDLIFSKDGRLFIVECKDYSGEISLQEDRLFYRKRRIRNFIKHLDYKVKRFNKNYNTEALGIIIVSNNVDCKGCHLWNVGDLHKLAKLIPNLKESNISEVLPLLTEEVQRSLRKEDRR